MCSPHTEMYKRNQSLAAALVTKKLQGAGMMPT